MGLASDPFPAPANPVCVNGSRESSLIHAGGIETSKQCHIADGNGAQIDNIFKIIGVCRVLALFIYVNSVTDSVTFSGVKFQVYDGTVTIDLCTTVDCSGALACSTIIKSAALGNPAVFLNSDQVRVDEPATNKNFHPFTVVSKYGIDTFLNLAFVGDANTNLDIDVHVFYEPLCNGSSIISV